MPPTPVLVNGPVSWNHLVVLDALPDPRPQMVTASAHWGGLGGTSGAKALALARLGVAVHLRTMLGDDEDADLIRAALHHPRLRLDATVVDGPSEHHLNLMSAAGERLSIYLDSPAGPSEPPDDDLRATLAATRVAVIDLAGHSVPLLGTAREVGTEIWCDLHDDDARSPFREPFRAAADVLLVSADGLPDVEGFLVERVAAGARWVVCTRGGRGALALSADEGWFEVDALAVQVQDTNGAGDSFLAGMLSAHLDGAPLERCLQQGTAAAALTVAHRDIVSPRLADPAAMSRADDVVVRRRV
ncbi:MAG: PfkB domain protein [Actinotalea sp.]|nr:PfkB domain protein [Actinotalea sp.]